MRLVAIVYRIILITYNALEVSPNNFGSLSITSGDWRDLYLVTFPVF